MTWLASARAAAASATQQQSLLPTMLFSASSISRRARSLSTLHKMVACEWLSHLHALVFVVG